MIRRNNSVRSSHPGAVIALCDNPLDANKVNHFHLLFYNYNWYGSLSLHSNKIVQFEIGKH